MKNLILVQSLINEIENATLNVKFHSEFDYPSDSRLWIKTFCKEQSMAYMQVLSRMPGTTWYFISNNELEVIDLEED